jgi:hypothetical protein
MGDLPAAPGAEVRALAVTKPSLVGALDRWVERDRR